MHSENLSVVRSHPLGCLCSICLWQEYKEELSKIEKENAKLRDALYAICELDVLGNDNQNKMATIARQAVKI